MMSMSKHCSSIYFRCNTTVIAFTLSVTVMSLFINLTSAPDDKSIGLEYCQKYVKKYHRYYWQHYQYSDINNPGYLPHRSSWQLL